MGLDDFLAAPDSVRQSAKERRKYAQRKEALKAEEARLNARKSQSEPSVEDLLADILRVATDEDTNPYAKFRSISRRRYELYGYYPVEFVDKRYGQFEQALRVAGLRDEIGTRLWRARRAQESRQEHADRYMNRYLAPYVLKGADLSWNEGGFAMLSINDTHAVFLHPFVWWAFRCAIRDLVPDCVLLNGDIIDGLAISKHKKPPGRVVPLQVELDFQKIMHRQIRDVFDGELINVGGNHDLAARLSNHLSALDPHLAGLRDLRIDKLLGLSEFDVKLSHGGSIMSPEGTERQKSGLLLFDFYRIHHGTKLGRHPAEAELIAAGRSGQSGHVHRAQLHYGTSERDLGLTWMCVPAGCRDEVARDYVSDTTPGWQQGFGFARLREDGTVHQYPCVVQEASDGSQHITVEGITYSRPADMHDPPDEGLWVDEKPWSQL